MSSPRTAGTRNGSPRRRPTSAFRVFRVTGVRSISRHDKAAGTNLEGLTLGRIAHAGDPPWRGSRRPESADGRALYFTKALNYRLPPGDLENVAARRRGSDDRGPRLFTAMGCVRRRHLLRQRGPEPGSGVFIDCHDFTTRSVRRVATLDRVPQVPGFSISSNGQWILFTGTDTNDSDVMMVNDFR